MTDHRTGTREESLPPGSSFSRPREGATSSPRRRSGQQRQELPWVRVEKEYHSRPTRDASLRISSAAAPVLMYHFMFGPDYDGGALARRSPTASTASLSTWRTTTSGCLVRIARALETLQAYKRRMGWTFPWALVVRERLQLRLQRRVHEEQSAGTRRLQLSPMTSGRSSNRPAKG